jgi:hypothetical protein|tara:strand:+ start:899 stop:1489 length:591 start_codon:yes stop_codon:yes gene_type:complete
MKELNDKLIKIQTEFKSKKSRFNSFGKYYFRSAEDILEATKPFLASLNVSVTVNEKIISYNPPVLETTATIYNGTDAIHATAIVGVDMDQKGMQMPQRFGAASSYGKKYALGNLFLIDDTQDADASNSHGVVDKIKAKAKPSITAAQLTKAKEYVAAGGKIETIESKYKLTAADKKELNDAKNRIEATSGDTKTSK